MGRSASQAASEVNRPDLRGRAFASLAVRDFRLLLGGTAGTQLGDWVQAVALGWLVFQLSHSPFQLGLISFVRGATILLVSPLGGVVADRVNRRTVIVIATAAGAVTATTLSLLVVTHVVQVWHLYLSAIADGAALSMNLPARQAIVYDIVGGEDLANAVALNSLAGNVARIIGPSLGGAIIGLVSVAAAFALQAACYLLSASFTFRLAPVRQHRGPGLSVFESFGGGFAYAWRNKLAGVILLMVFIPAILVYPYVSFLPVFARDVLHVGAGGYGLITSAVGFGSIVGASVVASRALDRRPGRAVLIGTFVYCFLVVCFAFSHLFVLSFFLLALAGVANSIYLALDNTLLQLHTEDALRGRVMAIFSMTFGVTPFATLLMGALIAMFGAPHTVAVFASLATLSVVLMGFATPRLRQL